jgi:hypothetical protein
MRVVHSPRRCPQIWGWAWQSQLTLVTLRGVNGALQQLLDANDGVIGWTAACNALSPEIIKWASRSGAVIRPFPGVVADPAVWQPEPPLHLRWRAALIAAGPGAALSHTTALAAWRLPVPEGVTVHVTCGSDRKVRLPGIVGHRRRGFTVPGPDVRVRARLPVTVLETSIVDAWPLLTADEQRAPLLAAVNARMTTPVRVRGALDRAPRLPERARLADLITKIEQGCRSPLELWGYERVFAGPGFARLRWQVPIRLGQRTVWLDAYDEDSATNFELDGAKYHASPRDRERDLQRDAELAVLGIHPVRFTHHRLTHEVGRVREQALAIMAVRRERGPRSLVA